MSRSTVAVSLTLCFLAACAAYAIDTENVLATRYRGHSALSRGELLSNCDSGSTDNRWENGLLSSQGRMRFEAGELLFIDKVDLHRKRVDLILRLAEPLLQSYVDGPFTLYREVGCRVELELVVGRDMVKNDDVEALARTIDSFLTVTSSLDAAHSSELWNGRLRDPYPEDYEQTLAEYAVWQVEQWNLAVDDGIVDALITARRIAHNPADGPIERQSFAIGLEAWVDPKELDCERLVKRSLGLPDAPDRPSTPGMSTREAQEAWDRGAHRGLALGRALYLIEALPGCFQELPPL